MALHIKNIEMLEAPKSAQVEKKWYGHDLVVDHFAGPLGRLAQNEAFGEIFEVLANLIGHIENISDFIICDHGGFCCQAIVL